jgi:hypothetical protein
MNSMLLSGESSVWYATRPVSTGIAGWNDKEESDVDRAMSALTDGGSVSGDRKLKESTPRLAPGRPLPIAAILIEG